MTMQFTKASRQTAKLKLAVAGPSGSGKTLGALALAHALAPTGKVALIDTENHSASLYGDKYSFDVLDLEPPYTSARYLEAMRAAIDAGYDVLIIDSLSHQWNGDGGILPRKEEMDKRPGSNSYTNWATFTKEHTSFVAAILHLPIHVIATLRAKQDYVLETNDKGKQQPKKVGLAPVQREGLEYEFTTVFDVQMDHRATVSKDRTGLFSDELVNLVDSRTGKRLVAWLATAKPADAVPDKAAVAQSTNGTSVLSKLQQDQIYNLLATADVNDAERAKIAKAAGDPKKPMSSQRADECIAFLSRLQPPEAIPDEEPVEELTDGGALFP